MILPSTMDSYIAIPNAEDFYHVKEALESMDETMVVCMCTKCNGFRTPGYFFSLIITLTNKIYEGLKRSIDGPQCWPQSLTSFCKDLYQ